MRRYSPPVRLVQSAGTRAALPLGLLAIPDGDLPIGCTLQADGSNFVKSLVKRVTRLRFTSFALILPNTALCPLHLCSMTLKINNSYFLFRPFLMALQVNTAQCPNFPRFVFVFHGRGYRPIAQGLYGCLHTDSACNCAESDIKMWQTKKKRT
jgi:hypothetical protein